MDCGVESGLFKQGSPEIVSFLVELRWIALGRGINGGVEALGRAAPAIDDEFPTPLDGFFLEIVTERPVPEHLEEGVVVGVVADVLEVVVLAAGTDAFLGVCGARWRVGGGFCA